MIEKRKVFTLGLIILMVLTSFPLMAYDVNEAGAGTDVPGAAAPMANGPKSPTNNASAGRFSTDVDNILSLTGWTGLSIDSWLGFAGWDNKLFSLGYARKIGGIYLGAWYNGNVVAAGEEDVEFVDVSYDQYGNPTTETTGYSSVTEQPWVYSNNRLALLLGIAGMGIKLDVRENYLNKDLPASANTHTVDKATGDVSGTNEISDYKSIKGWTDIYAGWGMAIPLGSFSIKPTAQLGVQLYTDEQDRAVKYTPNSGSSQPTYTNLYATAREGNNTAYIRPNIAAGASISGLPWGLGAGLEYGINFDIYTSSYDLYGGSDSVGGTVAWVYNDNYSFSNTTPTESSSTTSGSVTVEEKTRLQQTITPSLTYSTDLGERVKLGLKLNVPVTIGSETSKGKYTKKWYTQIVTPTGGDTTVTERTSISYAGGESETSTFKVVPALSIGVQVAAVPERLTLNLGLTNEVSFSNKKTLTKPTGVGYTTEKVTVGDLVTTDTKTSDPIGTKSDTSSVDKAWSDLNAKISAGFTFFFSPNFLIDTNYTSSAISAGQEDTAGISFGKANFWDDVVTGDFAVMFTIKK